MLHAFVLSSPPHQKLRLQLGTLNGLIESILLSHLVSLKRFYCELSNVFLQQQGDALRRIQIVCTTKKKLNSISWHGSIIYN
jgi:hypothetical protein